MLGSSMLSCVKSQVAEAWEGGGGGGRGGAKDGGRRAPREYVQGDICIKVVVTR